MDNRNYCSYNAVRSYSSDQESNSESNEFESNFLSYSLRGVNRQQQQQQREQQLRNVSFTTTRLFFVLISGSVILFLFFHSLSNIHKQSSNDSAWPEGTDGRRRSEHWNHSERRFGRKIISGDGKLVLYHLPGDTLYERVRDYEQTSHKSSQLNCLKAGIDTKFNSSSLIANTTVSATLNASHSRCLCRPTYSGRDCSIPEVISKTTARRSYERLEKPRKIVLSVCFTDARKFRQSAVISAMFALNSYVDLFVLHLNSSASSTHSKVTSHENLFERLEPKMIRTFNSMPSKSFEEFERDYFTTTWHVISENVVDYHPNDLLLLMACDHFPTVEVVLFAKHNRGISDVGHLVPLHRQTISQPSSQRAPVVSSVWFESFFSATRTGGSITSPSDYRHLLNVLFTFEYLTTLCHFSLPDFLLNYCQSRHPESVVTFGRHFWPVSLFTVGSLEHPATINWSEV